MKKRIYRSIECTGFDAYDIIEQWKIGSKWYEKQTTYYLFKGMTEDYISTQWVVYNFHYDPKGEMYCVRTELRSPEFIHR